MGTSELLVILILVLVFFGAGRITEVFTGLGKGIRNFKKALKEDDDQPKAS